MDLESAVTELYGLHPDEFMSARAALGRQAKDDGDTGLSKAITSVRKPTAAAWAVNVLTRAQPEGLEQLLGLAASLQDASERRDGSALRDLGRQRSALVDDLLRRTRDVVVEAGGTLSGPVAEQVRETFVAALASPPAAEAVGSGQLTRALSYAGFGDVDLSEALAAPAPARRPALHVVPGSGPDRVGAQGHSASGDDGSPGDAEEPPEASGPDPVLVARLEVAQARTRETTAEAATAGAKLAEATEALAVVDARITELEEGLREARGRRDGLVGARAEAAAADKVAQRTLRASFAELDAVQELLPEEE